jgi:hypothetical protein
MLGLSYGFPVAFIVFCHRRSNASPASMMGSEETTVPTPTAVSPERSGCVEQPRDDVYAPVLDLGGDRVLVHVSVVLVGGLEHELVALGFHPRGHERRRQV